MFRWDGRMVGMRMIDAQQFKLLFLGIFFCINIILGRNLKAATLIAFLYIGYCTRLRYVAAAIAVFMAKHKTTTFIGEGLYGIFHNYFLYVVFQNDHVIIVF